MIKKMNQKKNPMDAKLKILEDEFKIIEQSNLNLKKKMKI